MAFIYKLNFKNSEFYIGCTTRNPHIRAIELISHKGFQKPLSIEILEECKNQNRFEKEIFYIQKFKSEKCLNKSNGGAGPNGFKPSKKHIKESAKQMKKRWAADRKSMLLRVNSHKTKESQSKAGILGGYARAAKQTLFEVIENNSGKSIGIFRTKREFATVIGVTESTAGRYMSGKLKIGVEKYTFLRKEG